MDENTKKTFSPVPQTEDTLPHKPHHFSTKKVAVLVIIFLLLSLMSLLGALYVVEVEKQSKIPSIQNKSTTASPSPALSPTPESAVCTLEAKVCPDGSTVGRQGPLCEFTKCPGEK